MPRPELAGAALTYPEQGATLACLPGTGDDPGAAPPGYHHTRAERVIGRGAQTFQRAATALLEFDMHRRAGLSVTASAPAAAPGVVVVLRLGIGRLAVTAPCRVVYVIDEPARPSRPARVGFGYGTLPGHPETGEEAFVLRLEPDGTVRFTVLAFWRAATRLARLGGPLTRLAQHIGTRRYLAALVRLASTVDQ